MADFFDDDTAFRTFKDRGLHADSRAFNYKSALVLAVLGLYVASWALEHFGYPPLHGCLYMALERAKGWGLRGGSSTGAATAQGDANMQSGMLSRTFGLNGSSLLQKGVRGVAGALSKAPSDAPPGLGNWDNSCYQNSVIQGMASLPSLREYLSKTSAEFRGLDTETTNGALFDMVTKLNDPSNHGQNFWISGKLKSMSTFTQQDAQEYFSKILDAMDKEVQQEVKRMRPSNAWADAIKVAAKSLETIPEAARASVGSPNREDEPENENLQPKLIPNPLDGLLAQRVGCISCGYGEGLQTIPFNCITVSLGRGSTYDIRDCLDDYTNLEQIEGVECAKCTLLKNKATLTSLAKDGSAWADRLKEVEDALENDDFDDKTLVKKFKILKKNWTQSTKSRQAVIARAPRALVLHVNRSIFDEMTGAMYKNSANVSYPRVLDLGNWCLGSDVDGENWPKDPTKSMLRDANAEPLTNSPYQYRLRAAVTHYGSHGNGHYVCYRPHATTPVSQAETDQEQIEATGEQWWRFSDDSVYAVPEQQAHQGNIFMLFYERIDGEALLLCETVEEARQTITTESDIPLPPADIGLSQTFAGDGATDVPLPDDDDLLDDWSVEESLSAPGIATPPNVTVDTFGNVSEPEQLSMQPSMPPQPKSSGADIPTYSTPPPDSPPAASIVDTEMSETASEGAPSTQLTSDDEDLATAPPYVKPASSPYFMRTAGDNIERDKDSRTSLPLVIA